MDDYRNDRIIYDEGWQKVSTEQVFKPQTNDENEANESEKKPDKEKKKKEHTFPALVSIQLVVCIMIAVIVFTLKFIGSDVFDKISDWYDKMSEATLVQNSTFENFDLSSYLPSTTDQLSSTKDEV